MKAMVKTTDEIINVDRVLNDDDGTFFYSGKEPDNRTWKAHEIELLPDTPEKVTIEGWVARSYSCPRDLGLRVYSVKPKRYEKRKEWNGHGRLSYLIDHRMFPEITWESEPKRVKLTLSPMDE